MRFAEHLILHRENHYYSSGYSKPIDVSDVDIISLTGKVIKAVGTNPMLDLFVQHSFNGVTWQDVYRDFRQGVFRRFTGPGVQTITLSAFTRFIRLRWVIGGQGAMFQFQVEGVFRKRQTDDLLDPLIGFILGMQGSGGYYRKPDGSRRYPGLDLAGAACASSLNHVNAKFPKLASCPKDIGLLIQEFPTASGSGWHSPHCTTVQHCAGLISTFGARLRAAARMRRPMASERTILRSSFEPENAI